MYTENNVIVPEVTILESVRDRLFISDPYVSVQVANWIEAYLTYVHEVPDYFKADYPTPGPKHWVIPTLRVIGTVVTNDGGNTYIRFKTGTVFTTSEEVLFDMVSGRMFSRIYDHRLTKWVINDHGVMPISDHLVSSWGGDDKLEMLASLLLINPHTFRRLCSMVTTYTTNYTEICSKSGVQLGGYIKWLGGIIGPPPPFPQFIEHVPASQLALF